MFNSLYNFDILETMKMEEPKKKRRSPYLKKPEPLHKEVPKYRPCLRCGKLIYTTKAIRICKVCVAADNYEEEY